MVDEVETPEEIARHYTSAMSSVTLLEKVAADPDDYTDDETVIERNVEHLKIVVGWDFWTDEDMTPFLNAIASAK
tara:strand:+ start:386 stop:610 length:225 start_codon:yes stop_codon:yes gene_type:complete